MKQLSIYSKGLNALSDYIHTSPSKNKLVEVEQGIYSFRVYPNDYCHEKEQITEKYMNLSFGILKCIFVSAEHIRYIMKNLNELPFLIVCKQILSEEYFDEPSDFFLISLYLPSF